jgi:hypothetical protein
MFTRSDNRLARGSIFLRETGEGYKNVNEKVKKVKKVY